MTTTFLDENVIFEEPAMRLSGERTLLTEKTLRAKKRTCLTHLTEGKGLIVAGEWEHGSK